jgi:hypothetical protein
MHMSYKWYKFGCNQSIRKGTLLGEQNTFSAASRLHFEGSYETSHLSLTAHALQLVYVWLWSVYNEGHFTWRTKYLLSCILPSLRGIFLKLHTYHSLHMPHNCYKFGCNWSIMKGTLLEEQSTFTVSHLLFDGSFWNSHTRNSLRMPIGP